MTPEESEERDETPTEAESGDASESSGEEPNGGPDASELDKDPAYDPDDESLKGLKGG